MVSVILKVLAAIVLVMVILGLRYYIECHMRRKRFEEIVYSMIMDNSLLAAVLAVFLLAILFIKGGEYGWEELLDYKTLATIVFSALVGILLVILRRYWINRLEDNIKLTNDYKGLIKKYSAEDKWYTYENRIIFEKSVLLKENTKPYRKLLRLISPEVYQFAKDDDGEIKCKRDVKNSARSIPTYSVTFPIIVDARLFDGEKIIISEINKDEDSYEYKLPVEIQSYKDDLFRAHDTSHLYNQLNIRVNTWNLADNKWIIETGRTTYFNSMVTNRAIDYRLHNEMTVRDILQFGPFVPTLAQSKLSNHLGFNGFVITSDGKIPLVLRRGELSVAKRSYGPSVGASLKAKYCLSKEQRFKDTGLEEAILGEIKDELKLPKEQLSKDGIRIIAAYRDIVEGVKPQLLFFARTVLPSHGNKETGAIGFAETFKTAMQKKKGIVEKKLTPEDQKEEDGDSFVWIEEDKLRDYIYLPDGIIVKERKLRATPSTVVSLLLLKEYLEKNNNNHN